VKGITVGLFDFLFGSHPPVFFDPDELRRRLIDTAWSGDPQHLEELCKANRAAILEHFASWQTVPPELRGDAEGTRRYVEGLIQVAELFAQRLGRPQLLQGLLGDAESNPLARWQGQLDQARQLMAQLRYLEARQLLTDLLIDVRGLEGSGVERYLPTTLGLLAECCYQGREAEKGVPHLEQALALCRQSGDADGVIAYLGNLYEVHRYLGRPEPAAEYAERLAAALGTRHHPAAARWRRQAALVRTGEPLNRVVALVGEERFELDELRLAEGQRVQFVFERNRLTLRPATEHARRGDELGQAGRYHEALAAFDEAAAADPFDPHARYLRAFTLLHLERYAEAVDGYQETERLAPGWFHCRADLWLAEQLAGRTTPSWPCTSSKTARSRRGRRSGWPRRC
jgi:tetratricopeptide (TPR) repeat protein